MYAVAVTTILGLVIGFIGKVIMPPNDRGGLITSLTLGVCGAMLGGQVVWLQGWFTDGSPAGLAVSAASAVAFLLGYRVLYGAGLPEER